MEQKTRKAGSGGKRLNSGAKPMYGEKTVTLAFRVPGSHREAISEWVTNYLKSVKNKASKNEQTSNNPVLD